MKSRGGLGREALLPRFYFFALPFTLHRSPLSERLEQAKANAEASKEPERQTRATGKGALPSRACLALHAGFVQRFNGVLGHINQSSSN